VKDLFELWWAFYFPDSVRRDPSASGTSLRMTYCCLVHLTVVIGLFVCSKLFIVLLIPTFATMAKEKQEQPAKKKPALVLFASNRKALFNYEIVEKKEAGIVLTGSEVKSIRKGRITITESYAKFMNDGLFLINAHISPYQSHQKNLKDPSPTRSRKLLLHQNELDRLLGKSQEKGLALVPLSVYLKNNKIKIEIGVGRGKKKHDKRESIKKRDDERRIRREE